MRRDSYSILALVIFCVSLLVLRLVTSRTDGQSVEDAILVTESELARIDEPLPFFLAVGADSRFNYYQLREHGYFKTDRKTAKFSQPDTRMMSLGFVHPGDGAVFIVFSNGRIMPPNPNELTQANISSFTPYLRSREKIPNSFDR